MNHRLAESQRYETKRRMPAPFLRAVQSAAWIGLFSLQVGCKPIPPVGQESETATPRIAVQTVAVAQTDIQRVTTQPATVHAFLRTEIRARISGYIEERKVDIGDYVQAGAPLATIAVPELKVQLQTLNSRIDRAIAEEARSKAGIELAIANVQAARAKHEEAVSQQLGVKASLAAAEAEFQRTEDMVDRQSLQPRVLDEVRKKRDSVQAELAAVEAAVVAADAGIAVAQAEQASAEADLRAAEADTQIARHELQEVETQMDYTVLTAPFSGIITERSVDPGDLVRAANEVGDGQPLFVICQIDRVRVHVPVPERDAAYVTSGDSVTLRFPSFPLQETITASVTRTAGSLDPSTRTMLVEIELDNPENRLLPGMFGEASIDLETKTASQTLPARAVRFNEQGEAFVYVVSPADTIQIVNVLTGHDDGNRIEILDGVSLNQQVVDAHLERFTNGQSIRRLER